MRGLGALRPAMLEREAELAALEAALAAARSGTGATWLVGGDAGIGKTTLVRALADAAEPTETRVVWGRCWEDGGAPAYWPWTQVLGAMVGDGGGLRRLGPAAVHVAPLLPREVGRGLGIAAPAPPGADAAGERFRLFEAAGDFLRVASEEGPLLVVLEDLHAADEASLSLLQFAARHLVGSPILLVGTYRTAEAQSSPRRFRLLNAVAREGGSLLLTGLSRESVARLVERTCGVVPPEDLAVEIADTTEGNPFFVGEVARLLAARSQTPRGRLRLPEAVAAVIRRRFEGCDVETTAVLRAAAVLGRDFDVADLAPVTGRGVEHLLDVLGGAARLGVVEETSLNHWAFAHAVMRETFYDDLAIGERVHLHRSVAEVVEARRRDASAEIAHHRFEAARGGANLARAVDACASAGEAAGAVLAFEEAASWFGRALEVLERGGADDDGRRRYELLVARGEALLRGGSRRGGRESYLAAAEIARRLGDGQRLGRAALGYYGIYEDDLDLHDHSRELLIEEALAALPDEDSALRARLMMSSLRLGEVDFTVYDPITRAAVAMARRVGDRATLADVLWNWHYGHSTPRDLEARLPVAEELVELANEMGAKEQLVLALQWRLFNRFEAGDLSGTRADLRVGLREAESLRLPFLLWGITDMRGTVELLEGRFGEAERSVLDAIALGRRSMFPLAEIRYSDRLTVLRWAQGRLEEMVALAQAACEQCPAEYITPQLLRGIALAEAGRLQEARLQLDRILADDAWWWYGHGQSSAGHLAELCWLLGEPGPAATLVDVLQPFAGRHLVFGIMGYSLGSVDRYLGHLATLQGRLDDADASFEDAHRLHERLGAPWWLARGRMDHARMLLARGRRGDAEVGADLLAAAAEGFEALGAAPYAERATALLRRPDEAMVFRPDGDDWTIRFEGTEVRLRDSKGVRYLARLLASPARSVHALELTGEPESPAGDGIPERLRELQVEIEQARADCDLGRLERAEDRFDALMARLQDGNGNAAAERARQSVTRALRGAIDRVAAAHPALGEHLRTTIRTGTYSSYTPDARAPAGWQT